mmetsp:Transcript_16639/g.49784  ORF Transcript_16639/g.49784 Transcript_16639/m.49784 type:complete len:224 (+) Transcript_16639:2309-2980(+)
MHRVVTRRRCRCRRRRVCVRAVNSHGRGRQVWLWEADRPWLAGRTAAELLKHLQHLVRAGPGGRVGVPAALHQVTVRGRRARRERGPLVLKHYQVPQHSARHAVVGAPSGQQLPQRDAQRVHVGCLALVALHQHLGRHVARGALAVRRHVRLGASQLHAQPKVHHLGNHAGGVGGARLEHHVGGPVWERKCGAWYDGADEGGGRRELWGLTPQPLHLLRPPHT